MTTTTEKELLDGIQSWFTLADIARPLAVLGDRIVGGVLCHRTADARKALDERKARREARADQGKGATHV